MQDTEPNATPPMQPVEVTVAAVSDMPPPPRVWPVFVVGLCATPVHLLVSVVVVGVIGLIYFVRNGPPTEGDINDLMTQPGYALLLLLPSMFITAVAGITPAVLSPVPVRQRLGLVRSRLPWVTWPAFMIATPLCGTVIYMVFPSLAEDPGSNMRFLADVVRGASPAVFVVFLVVIALFAGVLEELLFRGYIQRRLLQRFKPHYAIAIASAMFMLMHIDPRHMIGITFIALWLGVIAWIADSVWPAIACHVFNNAQAVIAIRMADEAQLFGIQWTPAFKVELCAQVIALALAIMVLIRTAKRLPRPKV